MDRGFRDEASLRFFHPLSNRDRNARNQALDALLQRFEAWLAGYGTPFNSSEAINMVQMNGLDSRLSPVQEKLPDLLRIIYSCPFKDLSDRCRRLLEDLKKKEKKLKIPKALYSVSFFIPEEQAPDAISHTARGQLARLVPSCLVVPGRVSKLVPPDTRDDQTQMLFIDAFLQNNRLDHVTQVMGYHPHYLDGFLRTQQYLLRGDGPLPYHYRHYIAIMAAGRHQCSYLINLHTQEFILQGGQPSWLAGLEHIPQKLRDLYEINKILAHRPWLITKYHIAKLTKGKDNWSVSELVHALILLSHFHALCSFVYGCGITSEVDHEGGYTFKKSSKNGSGPVTPTSPQSCSPASSEGLGIDQLMARMRELAENDQTGELTHEELVHQFEQVETQSAELKTNSNIPSPKKDVLKFVLEPQFVYQDFAKRGSVEEIPTFRAQEYSWEDHGFSLANRYYSEIGTLLDDKFNCAYNLTYYTMGDKMNVDTRTFRRAVWNYIHCMYGIRHDDYNYAEVNQMLERNLKAYIKTVTCYPERLTKKEYEGVMRGFKHSEKVHVNLMLLEARLQGELLYALRAVMQHMT